MRENQVRLSEERRDAAYAITLAPDKVRFLSFTDFLRTEVDVWVEVLRKLAPQSVVFAPTSALGKGLDLGAIDALCPDGCWEARLRIHHALGKLFYEHDVPTYTYSSFHVGLALNEYNYAEFIRAWVAESLAARRTSAKGF